MLRPVRPQRVRRRAGLVALLALTACSAEEGASSRTPSAPVTVVSSIAEGDDLVGPVVWKATVTLAGVVQVRRVEFVVDEKVRWTQKSAPPYLFSGDGQLEPWVLGPGEHELVVRVVPNPGSAVEAVSHVTVPEAPSGSAAVAGTYRRQVTLADRSPVMEYRTEALGASGGIPHPGRYGLELTPQGRLTFVFPDGFRAEHTYTVTGDRLRAYGPAFWLSPPKPPPFEFCLHERAGDYTWELRGKQLVVVVVDRVCADRDVVLLGTWTRTG
jgi:hypothetical protein